MIKIKCPSKINLFLAIYDRDETGYHKIKTVLARRDEICDFLYLEKSDSGIVFECDKLPAEGNSVIKALKILSEESGKELNYRIKLEKNIRPGSGLGGGASDAAAAMLFLNEKENLGIKHKRMMELGAKIGMDVPFFLSGYNVALGTHYGEKISPLPELPDNLRIEIHQTRESVSTKEAYEEWSRRRSAFDRRFRDQKAGKNVGSGCDAESLRQKEADKKLEKIIKAIEKKDASCVIKNLHNDFQRLTPSSSDSARVLTGSGGAFCVFREVDSSQEGSSK